MKNLLFDHPHADVRAALIRLLDALTTWERSTGRHSVVIVKDELGGPVPCTRRQAGPGGRAR